MSDFRIIVTGGRTRSSAQDYIQLLGAFTRETDARYPGMRHLPVTIVQGGCPDGMDDWARVLAEECACKCETFLADWKKHGRAAGPIRNQAMADAGDHLCLAFPSAGKSTGTWDMIRRACAAGIETRIYPEAKRCDVENWRNEHSTSKTACAKTGWRTPCGSRLMISCR